MSQFPLHLRAPVGWSIACLAALTLAGPLSPTAHAQKLVDKSKPRNHPIQCIYCGGTPELMEAAGIYSHGGFEFGKTDTQGVDAFLATSDIRWIETEHFEIGIALAKYKVNQKERGKIRAELTRLGTVLPGVQPKARYVDPWLRAHLYAQRLEDLYARFLEIIQRKQEEFPSGKTLWNMKGEYIGEGPHLGQKGKYEVLVLPSQAASTDFLNNQFGLLTKLSQRFNVIDRDTLILVVHTLQGGLKNDEALHGHIVFNQTIQLFNGYKHYSYDGPPWLREGLGHWLERELNPNFNTFDSSEGATADMTSKSDWRVPTRKLVNSGSAPNMAQLMKLNSFADFNLEHHFTTWSIVDFLMTEHPDFFARLCSGVSGITNASGIADGSLLDDEHRRIFKEDFGMSYAQFDRAWSEWVLRKYGSRE